MPQSLAGRNIYSLTELATSLQSVIARTYNKTYWVTAELARLNHYPRSGHCYPDLVEKEQNRIASQMRAILWGSDFKRINQSFLEVTGQPLADGMQIMFQARITFHPVYGISLQIIAMEPSYTLGAMALARKKTIERLQSEGLWTLNQSLPLPILPRKVAVISVETSKGYNDFLRIIEEHPIHYALDIELYPAILQGDRAATSISTQLGAVAALSKKYDMVAIIRGGGDEVGLDCYDNYHLAAAVCQSPIPVITGIGHSTNLTVTEMVAAVNKITPTDVAYYMLEHFIKYHERLSNSTNLLTGVLSNIIQQQQQQLTNTARHLKQSTIKLTQKHHITLNNATRDIVTHTKFNLRDARAWLKPLTKQIRNNTQNILLTQLNKIFSHTSTLKKNTGHKLHESEQRMFFLEKHLNLLNPQQVLKRGYSITRLNGHAVTNAEQLTPNDTITTQLHNGFITSTIKRIKEHNHE